MTAIELFDTICWIVFWIMYFVCGIAAIFATMTRYHVLVRIAMVPLWMPMLFTLIVYEKFGGQT